MSEKDDNKQPSESDPDFRKMMKDIGVEKTNSSVNNQKEKLARLLKAFGMDPNSVEPGSIRLFKGSFDENGKLTPKAIPLDGTLNSEDSLEDALRIVSEGAKGEISSGLRDKGNPLDRATVKIVAEGTSAIEFVRYITYMLSKEAEYFKDHSELFSLRTKTSLDQYTHTDGILDDDEEEGPKDN